MQLLAEPLPIPARGVAGSGSFPLEPEAVAAWLAGLAPLDSNADARELLRGLMHANRLHNDVARRRAALGLFSGPLGALHERLADTARAQPLPLAPEFERARALAADLLREESIAFRALLVDAEAPRATDARLAMRALVRLVRLDANAYRPVDPATLADAHALHAWCRDAGLAGDDAARDGATDDGSTDDGSTGGRAMRDGATRDGPASVGEQYRLLIALVLIDPQRHRARQLPLLIEWLAREAWRLRLDAVGADGFDAANRRAPGRWLIAPRVGTDPVPTGAALPATAPPGEDRVPPALLVDARPLLDEAGRRMAMLRAGTTSLPGADTLERQTLARLAATLGPPPGRRFARRTDATPAELVFGHRHICARLFYAADDAAENGADDGAAGGDPGGSDAREGATGDREGDGGREKARNAGANAIAASGGGGALAPWRIVDRSPTGMQLVGAPRAGLAQVGELVSVHEVVDAGDAGKEGAGSAPPPPPVRHGLLVGVVRRVRSTRDGGLRVGVEFLAHQAMPVTIAREDDASAAPERALIVACRVSGRTLQTVLVPAFIYQAGDRLRAMRDGRSRRLELVRCLQVNGLFSQYVIATAG